MCDCGCGGSSGCGGNCGGDCGQPRKIIEIEKQGVTSGITYKGDAISCSGTPSLDVKDGDPLNDIIQKLLVQACLVGNAGNYTFNSNDQVVVTNANSGIISSETTGIGVLKRSEGIRVLIGGQFSSVTDFSGITVTLNYIAKDSLGNKTTVSVESWNIPQLTTADRFKIDATLFLDSTLDQIGYTYEVRTRDKINEQLYSNVKGTTSYAIYNDIGVEVVVTANGTDQIIVNNIVFEHLR